MWRVPGAMPWTESQALLDALPDMVVGLDEQFALILANDRCRTSLGWGPEQLGRPALEFVHPDDVNVVATSMVSIRGKPVGTPIEFRIADAEGHWHWIELIGSALCDDRTAPAYLCVARDITDRRKWEVANGDLERFQQVVQHAPSITLLLDANGMITSANNAFNRILGYDKSTVIGASLMSFATNDTAGRLEASMQASIETKLPQAVEVMMTHATERPGRRALRFEIRNLLDDPVVDGLVVTGHDISDVYSSRSELEFLARHDGLTGLANRALLWETMDRLVSQQTSLAVFFIDLDGFKLVNDEFGHQAGDELLQRVGRRLGLATRPGDLIARVGGDEFAVVSPGVTALSLAEPMAERLVSALSAPFDLARGRVRIGASVGIALGGEQSTVAGLLADADDAMYAAKAGSHQKQSSRTLRRRPSEHRVEMVEALKRGIQRGEIVAYLQPLIDIASDEVVSFEALARWSHPEQGLLSAVSFFQIAEDGLLDVEVGNTVLESACRTLEAAGSFVDHTKLRVNLSIGQRTDPRLAGRIIDELQLVQWSPDRVIVEISERAIQSRRLAWTETNIESTIDELRAGGIILSLDNFGSDASSLTLLGAHPFAAVKIDRTLVAGMGASKRVHALVVAVIAASKALGLTVVAEGVETVAQLDELRSLGVHQAQGNLISEPLSPAEVLPWLARRRQVVARAGHSAGRR
jgi:diguanylate cyclase (GGDEF)-like protein/PAS domain S-box-containing protein